MSVAKSYEKYPIEGVPYEKNKKEYVKIRYSCCSRKNCLKCAGQGYYLKEVRWYPEYTEFNAKKGFGFGEEGYITLLAGCFDWKDKYFYETIRGQVRFNNLFYWYVACGEPIPSNLPENIVPIQLKWEQISENNKVLPYDKIKSIVKKIIAEKTSSF